jgi:protein-S-isoprenylcysteine O-methyltransferase Ste14
MVERQTRDRNDPARSAKGPDAPGVLVWPPLVALAALVLGFLLNWLAPLFILRVLLSFEWRLGIGILLFGGGIALAVAGARLFRQMGTNANPAQPALTLVTTGIYEYLRNPMYVGLGLIVAGIGIVFASDWTLALLVPAALIIHFGVVLREEEYLSRKFGDAYRRYMETVPRYGWPV